ncbi:hypothetical protein ACFRCI_14125 [Streptomyces sp. NPDC056638]|uniref:hypothetical protein n=1 Tax=Streptomyces sp. NPDC056638 TaxID=3345887 RepID=UPI0036AA43F9
MRLRHTVVTAAAGSALVLGGMAAPGSAAASKYPGQVKCPKGDYQLCIDGGPGGFTISGRKFSGHANAIRLKNVGTYAMFSEWGRLENGETCGRGNVFKNNKYGIGYYGKGISLIKWGGRGGGKTGLRLTWGNCKKASIVNKGGNSRL